MSVGLRVEVRDVALRQVLEEVEEGHELVLLVRVLEARVVLSAFLVEEVDLPQQLSVLLPHQLLVLLLQLARVRHFEDVLDDLQVLGEQWNLSRATDADARVGRFLCAEHGEAVE